MTFKFAAAVTFVAALSLSVPAAVRAEDAPAPPSVGATAPEFTLTSQEGKPVSLKDYRGKWVVLYFYPKDFTKGCTIEAHGFQNDLKKYAKRGAVILGVSVQSADSHKDFCAKEGLNFKLLADTEMAVSKSYGSIMTLPIGTLSARNTFLVNPKGVIAKEYIKVAPAGHSREVLAALDELKKEPAGK